MPALTTPAGASRATTRANTIDLNNANVIALGECENVANFHRGRRFDHLVAIHPQVRSGNKFGRQATGLKEPRLPEPFVGAQLLSCFAHFFPNPASDMIYLTSNGKKGGEMRITDLSGSMVLKQPIRANDKVDISALPAGVYVVNLVSGQAIQRQKLLIVR